MTKKSLTSTLAEVIAPASVMRRFLLSAGKFSTAVVAYVEVGDSGDPDVLLSSGGSTSVSLKVPAGAKVSAWTDAGTAELGILKVEG